MKKIILVIFVVVIALVTSFAGLNAIQAQEPNPFPLPTPQVGNGGVQIPASNEFWMLDHTFNGRWWMYCTPPCDPGYFVMVGRVYYWVGPFGPILTEDLTFRGIDPTNNYAWWWSDPLPRWCETVTINNVTLLPYYLAVYWTREHWQFRCLNLPFVQR
jgi:hypothetical protein